MGVSLQTPCYMGERHPCKPPGVGQSDYTLTRRSEGTSVHSEARLAAGFPISLPLSPWPDDGADATATGAAVASAGTRRA